MPEWVPGRVRLVGEEGLGLYGGMEFREGWVNFTRRDFPWLPEVMRKTHGPGQIEAVPVIFLLYVLPLLLFYAACAWGVLGTISEFVNRRRLPGKRICIGGWKRGILVTLLLLLANLVAVSYFRPPEWRGILYEEMFDACRDNSLARARLWLLLGASPDGASDYEAAPKWMEFGSHVDLAAMHKDCRLLRLLLEKGADPSLGCGDGSTPMTSAINEHNSCAVKLLLEAGADTQQAMVHAKNLKADELVSIIRPYLREE